MCGIIGYVGNQECASFLLTGLKRLEYRGYDSAGIACCNGSNGFKILKAEGKLENIERQLKQKPLTGKTGIGHTRWATHGKPNYINAHPHRAGSTVLVHNGISENYEELRQELTSKGYKIVSETDSELFGHLVEDQKQQGLSFLEAVRTAFLRLKGSCSVVVVNDEYPDLIVAIRNGTSLVVSTTPELSLDGKATKYQDGCFVASDPQAILEHSSTVTYLENEDFAVCRKSGFEIYSVQKPIKPQNQLKRKPITLDWPLSSLDKAGFPYYMLKEIHEQPRALLDTLDNFIERDTGLPLMKEVAPLLLSTNKVQFVACGTAWHAALVGKYLLEKVARIPTEVDLASEYRHRDPMVGPDTLVIAISQSGETADTIAALREAKKHGAMTAAICNVRGSTLSREAGVTLYTAAGPEIGVASTKAFTTQILVLMMLAQYGSICKKMPLDLDALGMKLYVKLPHLVQEVFSSEKNIEEIVKQIAKSKGYLFVARGRLYPIALEGALKMKEITYLHAEGFAAGELKHGPIALVDSSMTVIVLAPQDELYEKTFSNLQEIKARGGKILAIGNKNDQRLQKCSDYFLGYPFCSDWSDILVATVPLQFLAYYMAIHTGTNVDQPRNLAKSVTVD